MKGLFGYKLAVSRGILFRSHITTLWLLLLYLFKSVNDKVIIDMLTIQHISSRNHLRKLL